MRILVVDDEMAIGKLLETALKNRGHEVLWIDNADDILSVTESFSPDVILLDINMPGKSGFDALKELREAGFHKPVIIMSVLSQDFNIDKAYSLGAVDYVIKPFSLNYLINKVERLSEG